MENLPLSPCQTPRENAIQTILARCYLDVIDLLTETGGECHFFPVSKTKEKKQEKTRGKRVFDHEALEVAFYANGHDFLKTSQATGCPKNTLYVLSKRKGWTTTGNAKRKIEEGKKELEALQPEIVTRVSDVVRDAFQDQKEGFKANMSQAMSRAGEYVATLPPDAILSESRKVKDIMDTGSKLYGFGEDGSKAGLSVNILNLTADSLHSIR